MLRFFKRPKRSGTYRTAKQRLSDERDAVDLMLMQTWRDDLKRHPEYLREIARSKFGIEDTSDGAGYAEPPPSFVEQLREVKEAKEALTSIFGDGRGGLLSYLPEILKALPQVLQGLQPAVTTQPDREYVLSGENPPDIERPQLTEEEVRQQQVIAQIQKFLSLTPEQAALHLYVGKDTTGTLEQMAWNAIIENSLDGLMAMLPTLESLPQFAYLMPMARALASRKKWLALLTDEVHALNDTGTLSNSAQIDENYNQFDEN